jgi:hypothetical protein
MVAPHGIVPVVKNWQSSGVEILDRVFEEKLSTWLSLSKTSGRSTGGCEAGWTLYKIKVASFVEWYPKREDFGLSSGKLPSQVLQFSEASQGTCGRTSKHPF